MAPMKQPINRSSSNNHGEDIVQQANVLASCYLVDSGAALKGLHYCTTSLAGAECPPLAAITANNELALTPKKRSGTNNNTARSSRRGGATFRIREECERFFCETMHAVFHGERNTAPRGSGLTGVYNNNYNGQLNTPPSEYPFPHKPSWTEASGGGKSWTDITAWLEIWDYAGGASFRAFVADTDGEKSLFIFYDVGVGGRDLKPSLMAMIELAEAALGCSQMVICVDRSMATDEANALVKGLRWAGFSSTTLDFWAGGVDVISRQWLFMGMEV